jgi:hypothetical protein
MAKDFELPAQCPPASATPRAGRFFRLVRSELSVGEQTEKGDWRKPYKNGVGQCAGGHDVCECHAFSVYSNLEDAEQAIALVPPYRPRSIAVVEVNPELGVFEQTPTTGPGGLIHDSHHEWWPSPNSLVPNAIVVVGSEGRS